MFTLAAGEGEVVIKPVLESFVEIFKVRSFRKQSEKLLPELLLVTIR